MQIDHPFRLERSGATALTGQSDHLRDMLEQLLLTSPGERVNRADFGCGLLRYPFEPNAPELAAAVQFTVQSAIQRWLGDVLEPRTVTVTASEAALEVTIVYLARGSQEPRAESFRWSTP